MNKRGRPKLSRTKASEMLFFDCCPRTIRRIGLSSVGFSVIKKIDSSNRFFQKYGNFNRSYFEVIGKIVEKVGFDYAVDIHSQVVEMVEKEKMTTKDVIEIIQVTVNSNFKSKII